MPPSAGEHREAAPASLRAVGAARAAHAACAPPAARAPHDQARAGAWAVSACARQPQVGAWAEPAWALPAWAQAAWAQAAWAQAAWAQAACGPPAEAQADARVQLVCAPPAQA